MKKINTAIFWISLIGLFIVYSSFGALKGVFTKNKQAALLQAMRAWGKCLLKVNHITYEVEGLEKIDPNKSYIFAANHQSIIDILFLAAIIPVPFIFMVKKTLFKVPLFGYYMKKAGFISVDRKNPKKDYQIIMKTIRDNPINILIFPEGTRSYDGSLGVFKSGVAKFAELTQFPTIPISVSGTIDIMNRGNLKITPGKVIAKVGDPIFWDGNKKDYLTALREEIRANIT